MNEQTELLREIVDLLRLIAEPHLARRDANLRNSLYEIVGKSQARAKAVFLMNGERNQSSILKEAGMDKGNLSRLTKSLADANLIEPKQKFPKLKIPIPQNFPDKPAEDKSA
jgi:DNA-binding MarR family transcriptional regulator